MKLIPLSKGKVAIVDDEDFERVSEFKWCYIQSRKTGYARRSASNPEFKRTGRRQFTQILSRFLLNASIGVQVDHRNGDGLDNRRCNLRLANQHENSCNRGRNITNTSGFKGVSYFKVKKRWRADIRVHGKLKYLGLFDKKTEAAMAYEKAALLYHGDFARAA